MKTGDEDMPRLWVLDSCLSPLLAIFPNLVPNRLLKFLPNTHFDCGVVESSAKAPDLILNAACWG